LTPFTLISISINKIGDVLVAAAKAKAEELARVLRAMGWPEPLQALSGNGWHLQYRIALPG
jgi:hypothetical protein